MVDDETGFIEPHEKFRVREGEKWATAPSKIREISGEHPPVPNSSPSAWLVFDLLRGG
jgi:hypothetical protein